jgi:hypothetical protein
VVSVTDPYGRILDFVEECINMAGGMIESAREPETIHLFDFLFYFRTFDLMPIPGVTSTFFVSLFAMHTPLRLFTWSFILSSMPQSPNIIITT